jgi:hypothetical protein
MIPLITAANPPETCDLPNSERVQCIVTYCMCGARLDEHDRCPKCDPPPLDYSDSWKV